METTILNLPIEKKPGYPFLAEYHGSFIVLFVENNSGMVIHSDGKFHSVGTYSDSWTISNEDKQWKILDEVTIQFKS